MEAVLTQLIQSQGVWAVLFVFLLLYTIKKNDKLDELQDAREKEYRELLLELIHIPDTLFNTVYVLFCVSKPGSNFLVAVALNKQR